MKSIFVLLSLILLLFSGDGDHRRDICYLKLGSYPEDATHDWNPNGTESQGVTHDDENWYFTNTDYDGGNARLWRIPAVYALDQNVKNFPGVKVTAMLNVPELTQKRYNHWGDPDHYNFGGTGYILVPMTSDRKYNPAIGVFRARDLKFITINKVPDRIGMRDIGWCAISPGGDLFTSRDDAEYIYHFWVNWADLITAKNLTLFFSDSVPVRGENNSYLSYPNMQGGEFSDDGKLLYISCGSGECCGQGHGRYTSDGIHVLETDSFTEVKRSVNSQRGESGFFDFSFNNGCACLTGSQTPEGLTYWNLDNGIAPNSYGQLHVLVNFYNRYAACDDALSLQHFRKMSYPSESVRPAGQSSGYLAGVELFEHIYYKGSSRFFSFNTPDLDLGNINFADVASSIKIYNIKSANLYDGHHYTGNFISVSQNIPDLRQWGWNDRTGSLTIQK